MQSANTKFDLNDESGLQDKVLDQLMSEKLISQKDIEQALKVYDASKSRFIFFLVNMGLISETSIASSISNALDLPLLSQPELQDLQAIDIALSVKYLNESYVAPVQQDDQNNKLIMADPTDSYAIQSLELATGEKMQINVATLSQVEKIIHKLYGEGQASLSEIADEIEINSIESDIDSIQRLKDLASEAPIIRLVNLIINRAIERRASDIHIEPFENQLKVRYRIDGILVDTESPPAHSTAAVISRIKIMAKLNIAERRLPQDGRIQLRVQGKNIDMRVSTVPTVYGESLVLRILDKTQVLHELEQLGFDRNINNRLKELISIPHGIILVTGPTGSGKTTTLYAAMEKLNHSDKKILTVEDPVEYQLEGINQIQVKPQIGLNFADALRSIVRQDPDIIMIGEMRDLETAKIAIQSALTGHLVFSTLHTNDAGSSITRLMDMGVEDYLLTSTLNGVLAQRLVRTLCQECREPFTPPEQLVSELHLTSISDGNEITLYRAKGCEACSQTGYLGRVVIAELLSISESLRQLVLSHADSGKIQQTAMSEGMVPMQLDGFKKALSGITTIEEVTRATQDA